MYYQMSVFWVCIFFIVYRNIFFPYIPYISPMFTQHLLKEPGKVAKRYDKI